MLAFISFILVLIGSVNWFCIGILQYDFVAGLFGSQSNVFSRLIYTIIGIASIIVAVNLIKNKGKFIVSFKKANKEYNAYMEEKKEDEKQRVLAKAESSEELVPHKHAENKTSYENHSEITNSCDCRENKNCECGKDCHCGEKEDEKRNND